MKDLDITRGFTPPNTEKNFRILDKSRIISTHSAEEDYFLMTLPMQFTMKENTAVTVDRTESGVILQMEEKAMTNVVSQLRRAGFPKEPATTQSK